MSSELMSRITELKQETGYAWGNFQFESDASELGTLTMKLMDIVQDLIAELQHNLITKIGVPSVVSKEDLPAPMTLGELEQLMLGQEDADDHGTTEMFGGAYDDDEDDEFLESRPLYRLTESAKELLDEGEQPVVKRANNLKPCVTCKKNQRMVSSTGKTLTMCETCQRDYWSHKKNPSAAKRRPIKERTS